ncbi:hypothetical protein ACFLU6_00365 [Acidobacteriota bacterium]
MRKPHAFMIVAIFVLFNSSATAQVEIDLAIDDADWTVWGSISLFSGSLAGHAARVGDINGDGNPDLILSEASWNDPVSGLSSGRVLVYFGPHTFPDERDLEFETPPLVIFSQIRGYHFGALLEIADVDNDSVDDLLITSNFAGNPGSIAIFLGRMSWPGTLTLADADWRFDGADSMDNIGHPGVGDINGDGAPDLVFSAGQADGPGNARPWAGEMYVFFGPPTAWPGPVIDLAVDAADVMIYGADGTPDNPADNRGDRLGIEIRIADIIGDPIPDLIAGASSGAGPANNRVRAGEVYVLAGRRTWPGIIDLKTDQPDFLVYGEGTILKNQTTNLASIAVADWDDDGNLDLILGAWGSVLGGPSTPGAIFVLRGRNFLTGTWDLGTRNANATILGPRLDDQLGWQVKVGDINGDGYLDVVSNARFDPTPYSREQAGSVSVILGCDGLVGSRSLSTDPPELFIYGADEFDILGSNRGLSVSDVDGDGRDDIFVGASTSDSLNNARGDYAGEAHLILGFPFSSSHCTIAADAGPDELLCDTPGNVILDGSGTTVQNCAATPEYRWMQDTTVISDWITDPRAVVWADETRLYRLEVRCGDCDGPCYALDEMLVEIVPDIEPPDLGNTLFAVRSNQDVELSWAAVIEAYTYTLHRNTLKGVWPATPFMPGLMGTFISIPDVPGPPPLYFYRSAGASCSGKEGP